MFTQEPLECNGYVFKFAKEYKVVDNHLSIQYKLTNLGSKTIEDSEYVHNFINIDGGKIGPDYSLRMPYNPKLKIRSGNIIVNDNEFLWDKIPETYFYCYINDYIAEPHYWELIHKPSGTGVRESSNFSINAFHLWGTDHVISPEVFVKISVKPGESFEWERNYEFF